jgi:hypothetical protein
VYAFEIVAAQSTGPQRRAAQTTLAALLRLETAVTGSSSTAPAGWSLPFPVTTPAAARRLATETLRRAVDAGPELAGAAPTAPHGSSGSSAPTAAALEDITRWSATVQALAVDWNLPLTAFPGASS